MDTDKASPPAVNVVEQFRVAPPPAAVPTTVLPLTLFDVVWLSLGPVQRLFFYKCTTITTADFVSSHLPAFRRSLSLTLQSFFSLAGYISPDRYVIEYADGDSVLVFVAESNQDFAIVITDEVKHVEVTHPLVPPLPPADDSGRFPVMALQFTVFPGAGFTLGVTVHHAAADGTSSIRFLKSWAEVHRRSSGPPDLPIYDRGALLELEEEKIKFMETLKQLFPASKADENNSEKTMDASSQSVRATFVLVRDQIEKLRDRIMSVTGTRPSTFVAACSHVWVCLTKARRHEDRTVHFAFAVDCRTRLDPPVPDAYIGNVVSGAFCEASGAELTVATVNGLVKAAEVINAGIRAFDGRALIMFKEILSMSAVGERVVTVAGSPRLRVYETDFGWGPPKKVEVISIEEGGAISLAENREGDGGLEIGLAGPVWELEAFATFFYSHLENL